MSAPRPYVTDPFHPLNSIYSSQQFLYICHRVLFTSFMWYVQVCLGAVPICLIARALLQKHSCQPSEPLFKSCFVSCGTCWCILTQICAIYACASAFLVFFSFQCVQYHDLSGFEEPIRKYVKDATSLNNFRKNLMKLLANQLRRPYLLVSMNGG